MSGRQQEVPAWFAQRIVRERGRLGLSMRQLAGKAGLAPSCILRAERGHDVALSSAIAIARALGRTLDWLLAERECETCDCAPPAGFICSECGRGGAA